jgi:SNF2 family DNA or RNA helicase
MRWDLSAEINLFFENEKIHVPRPAVERLPFDLKRFLRAKPATSRAFEIHLRAAQAGLLQGFERLVCLDVANVVELDHQVKTVKSVLTRMRGRAILADEVGLGKTIEAGMAVKELMLRGLAKEILIVAPAGLCRQWQSEFKDKFNEDFSLFAKKKAEPGPRTIVSYETVRNHADRLERFWDVIVLDEAHRLKNRGSLVHRAVRRLQSRFLLALTATPLHNTLDELYALADMMKPGIFGTLRTFRTTYVSRKNPRSVAAGKQDLLKETLAEVMIRNRRDSCGTKFPRRRVGIYRMAASKAERDLYTEVTAYVKEQFKLEVAREAGVTVQMLSLVTLQRELMSTPEALCRTLQRMAERPQLPGTAVRRLEEFIAAAKSILRPAKLEALEDILGQDRAARVIVFTEFAESARYLSRSISGKGRHVFQLTGGTSADQRVSILDAFRATDGSVLVSTETGGIGLNLQFCRHLVNFDLPWNPQRIEQRIGRIDRIGQAHNEIYVFNLVCEDTIEEHVLDLLALKLRMFELVIGEMSEVLGMVSDGGSFESLVARAWLGTYKEGQKVILPEELADSTATARQRYDHTLNANMQLCRQ